MKIHAFCLSVLRATRIFNVIGILFGMVSSQALANFNRGENMFSENRLNEVIKNCQALVREKVTPVKRAMLSVLLNP